MNLHYFTASNGLTIEYQQAFLECKVFDGVEHVTNMNVRGADLQTANVTGAVSLKKTDGVDRAVKEFLLSQGFEFRTFQRKKGDNVKTIKQELRG